MILMIVFHLKRGKTEGELTSFHCKDSIERRAGGRSWSLNWSCPGFVDRLIKSQGKHKAPSSVQMKGQRHTSGIHAESISVGPPSSTANLQKKASLISHSLREKNEIRCFQSVLTSFQKVAYPSGSSFYMCADIKHPMVIHQKKESLGAVPTKESLDPCVKFL